MGAVFDVDYGEGTDLNEVYRAVADQAAYEHGHSYSGTIAESTGVVLFRREEMSREAAVELAWSEEASEVAQKWGPAQAIPVPGGFVFFGWYSS